MEEEVEGWPQLASDVAVVGHEDADEHGLVDLASKLRPGFVVGAVEVCDKREGGLEMSFDDVELELKGAKPFLDVVEFGRDAVLLGSQQIERNRAGIVGFEELGAFVEGAALPRHELLSFESCVLAKIVDLLEDDLLRLELEVFTEL